jgi:hypothetical protein
MRLSVSALAYFLLFSFGLFAQEEVDFSGIYVQTSPKPKRGRGMTWPPPQLKVVQSDRVLEATFSEQGKTRRCTYYLDGAESNNVTPGGAPSRDKARVTKRALLIESIVRPPRASTTLQVKQKWQLSRDSQHLTIQTTVSAASGIVAGFPVGSFEEEYTREPW